MPQTMGSGAADALTQILQEQFLRAQEAQRIKEADRQGGQRDRQLDLEQRRLDISDRPEAVKPMSVGGRLVMPDGTVVYEPPAEPTKPMVVGGRLVNPDGSVLYEPKGTPRVLSPGQVAFDDETGEEMFSVPDRPTAAGGSAGGGGGTTPRAASDLARMVAGQPQIMKSMTPTLQGEVLGDIASNPELRGQMEQQAMQPIQERAQKTLSAVEQLLSIDPNTGESSLTPGAKTVFGEFTLPATRGVQGLIQSLLPGGVTPAESADANAALSQLTGQMIVDLIADMKSQSQTGATGFGQLNIRELGVLEAAASQLTQRLSEGAGLRELNTIREKMLKILNKWNDAGAAAPTPGAPASENRVGRFEIVTE